MLAQPNPPKISNNEAPAIPTPKAIPQQNAAVALCVTELTFFAAIITSPTFFSAFI
jgi:hypothetical protein